MHNHRMPRKKSNRPPPTSFTVRLTSDEIAPVSADLQRVAANSVPVSLGKYAKHAVLSYAKLRRLEQLVKECAASSPDIAELRNTWIGGAQ